jgi:hypothetical protein
MGIARVRTVTSVVAIATTATLMSACGSSSKTAAPAASTTTRAAASSAASATVASAAAGPVDVAGATAQVKQAYSTFFSSGTPASNKLAHLESASTLGAAIKAAGKAIPPGQQSATVSSVTFTTPTEANLTYSLSIGGKVVLPNADGGAVLEAGTWKVAKKTFCTLVLLGAGVSSLQGC